MRRGPHELADFLAALPVRVASVRVRSSFAEVADYPGGRRPTSVVCLSGGGHSGFGENVAFTEAEHQAFTAEAEGVLSPGGHDGSRTVGAMLGPGLPPYARAALEAALIDLGMRQAGVSLADLTGVTEARLRFVVSFAACPDPAGHVGRLRARGYTGELKVDVDPSWSAATLESLARLRGVAILDFKGRSDAAQALALAQLCPRALLEDPPAGTAVTGPGRIARDAPLVDSGAVAAAVGRHESVNLKAPRMGGPLEVLRSLRWAAPNASGGNGVTAAATPGATTYFGGMFEVGVGRIQARQLAALFCHSAPNDLAPIGRDGPSVGAPLVIRLDRPGFGVSL